MDEKPRKSAFNVIYGNYFPREVESSWWTREKAEARIAELEAEQESAGLGIGMWEVEEVEIQCPTCNDTGEVEYEYGFACDIEPRQAIEPCPDCGSDAA